MARVSRVLVAVVGLFVWMAAALPVQAPEPRHPVEIAVYNTAKIVYSATYKSITGDDICDQGQGTGVLLAPDKVLTCQHLIDTYFSGVFTIAIANGQRVQIRKGEQITILKHDDKNDLLLLQVNPPFEETGVSLARELPSYCELVYFTGYTVLPVSTMRFTLFNINSRGIMLFPIYKGDSGGGVFNKNGELIGIINMVIAIRDGGVQFPTFIGYAIPLTVLQEFLK